MIEQLVMEELNGYTTQVPIDVSRFCIAKDISVLKIQNLGHAHSILCLFFGGEGGGVGLSGGLTCLCLYVYRYPGFVLLGYKIFLILMKMIFRWTDEFYG